MWSPPASRRELGMAMERAIAVFCQADDGIRYWSVTGVQTYALPILRRAPATTLCHQVVAGARRIGSVLAEAGDRAIDQPRAIGREALVVEAEFGEAADLEVLD